MENKETNISRRALIGASVLGAASFLASCSSPASAPSAQQSSSVEENESSSVDFDVLKKYLPLGSIVQLNGFSDHAYFMVVSRRPKVSDDEEVPVPDYGAVWHPFGVMALAGKETEQGLAEIITFDTSDIKRILFVGYVDPVEEEAAAELEKGRGGNVDCMTLMLPLLDSYFNVNEILEYANNSAKQSDTDGEDNDAQ